MGMGGKSAAGTVSLEQLIALDDEMAALVRAGVPLEHGLAALGGEMPGPPGRLARLLASRMEAGESLSQILVDDERTFPPVWRAVVEAGLRSGRLAAALESLSKTARRTADLRRMVGAGAIYPLVVLSLAYLLFIFLVSWVVPGLLYAHLDSAGRVDVVTKSLVWLEQHAVWWMIPLPLIVAVLLGFWWHRTARASWAIRSGVRDGGRGESGRLGRARQSAGQSSMWFSTGIRQTLRNGRMATFAEILSLLIEHKVPMDEAIVLAAKASGDPGAAAASQQMAEQLRRGEVAERPEDLPEGFPPMMAWLLARDGRNADLSEALARSAAIYRRRATRAATWTAIYLPISLTVLVGGTATLLVALAAFLPFTGLLYDLSRF